MSVAHALRSPRWLVLAAVLSMVVTAAAGDLRLSMPKRTKPTPVQKLNQDGVKAVQKHDYEKAKRLFYRAYLVDPNDPFTLNNLGYISELEGDLDRAQRYYALASDNTSDALVYRSSDRLEEGKPVSQIAGTAADRNVQINRLNVQAMSLLGKERAPEADVILQRAYALDPQNPFTLNNLGYAKEKEGEVEMALRYYQLAANSGSRDSVVVTTRKDWRGKPISEIASQNVRNVRKQLEKEEDVPMRVARLNLRGVSALNRNDRRLARQYFTQAYKMNPNNAFTMNNMGYVSELEGDRETANFFYAKAQTGDRSGAKVAMATRRDAEGLKVGAVAASNDQSVEAAQNAYLEARRREGKTPALFRRDNTVVVDQGTGLPARSAPRGRDASEVMIAVPAAVPSQPTSANQPEQEPEQPVTEPLPESAPPRAAASQGGQPTQAQPPQGKDENGGLLMPLPDQQQSPDAGQGQQQQPSQAQPPQDNDSGGLLMPLPEPQQPPAAGQQPQTTRPNNPK